MPPLRVKIYIHADIDRCSYTLEDHQFLPFKIFIGMTLTTSFTIISPRMSNIYVVGWQTGFMKTLILIVVSFSESERKVLEHLYFGNL